MKSAVPFALLAMLAPAFAALGCAHGDAEERKLVELRDELSRVQADRDRVDQRLVALETQVTSHPDASAPVAKGVAAPAPAPTPPLRVVRIGADGSSESVSAEETAGSIDDGGGARPVLRVTGGSTRHARGAKAERADQIVETLPPEGPEAPSVIRERAPRPSALDPEARQAYDDALALVRGKKCQAALDAFAGFIVRWPDHPNADNAMYWRGECYAEMGDLPRAIEQFEGTIARFPLGNKVPDALLKLGLSYAKLGNQARAKEAYDRLEREFPKSEARRRIPQGALSTP